MAIVCLARCITSNLFYFTCRVVARLGDLNLDDTVKDEAEPTDVKIANVIIHEQYNAKQHIYDIALLKLEKSVQFSGKYFKFKLIRITAFSV